MHLMGYYLKSSYFQLFLAFYLSTIPIEKTSAQPVKLDLKEQGPQGRVFAYWGWNRGYYTKSDIHFSGEGYDFTLEDVVAKDRQSEFSFRTYFHPAKITIPQVNYGIGYYFRDHYIVTLGLDHMKYVVQRPQEVTISGKIFGGGLPYQGDYDGEHITIQDDLLKFEHTNGLNYLSVGILRTDNLFKKLLSLENKMELNLAEGFSAGVLIPKSNVTLLSKERNDQFHLSGFGLSASIGLQVLILKHFFLRGELKAGYINLPSITTSADSADRADQHFFFLQPTGQFGWAFFLHNKMR